MSNASNTALWKSACLITCQVVAFFLLISWLSPTLHPVWMRIDTWFFYTMNGSMIEQPSWQYLMALANHRLADLVPASLVAILFLHFSYKGIESGEFTLRITYGINIIVLLLLTIIFFKFGIYKFLLQYLSLTDLLPRKSATYIFDNTVRLDTIYPSIDTKVLSKDSFPGDHATVLIFFTVLIRFYAGRVYGSMALIITMVFIMPRLIGGAHWLSDIIVGSTFIVLTSTSLYLATPFQKILTNYLYPYVDFSLCFLKQKFLPFSSSNPKL